MFHFHLTTFADDTTNTVSNQSVDGTIDNLKLLIDTLNSWFQRNKLITNP